MGKLESEQRQDNKVMRTAAQTAVLMAILTLVSKLFGFVREMVMAGAFGTGDVTDAYVMAIAIPSMIFVGFYQAVDTAYMPLFSKIVENDGVEKGNQFTSEALTLGLLVALASSIVGILFADPITSIFASGFSGERAVLTASFLKITFSYALFTSVAGLLETFLRYRGIFLAPIIVGYVQNAIIIAVIIISAYTSHYFLVCGWLLAYAVRLVITWLLAKKNFFRYSLNKGLSKSAKQIIALSLPVFVGGYISQFNIFVDKTLASGLPVGSVAALNFGNLLVNMVIGLTVSIIITVVYPRMTQAQALGNIKSFNEMASTGFHLIVIIALPCMLGAMMYSEQVVQVIYERGAFNAASTALTSTAFFFYSIGMLFLALNSFMTQIFYSKHDMKTPVKYGVISAIINVTLNLCLVRFMAHGGLALATSIAAMCNTGMLYFGLRGKYKEIELVKSWKKLLKIMVSAVVAVGCSWVVFLLVSEVIPVRMVTLGISVGAAGLIYLALLKLSHVEELGMLVSIVRR